MQEYKIKLDSFEGPMDLLMHLIEKNKIDIYDIPIALLTQQYMEYLDASREFNIEIASEFLVMAATLLQIKSRMMLPKPPKEEAEEGVDPRQELVERILEYRRFQQVSTVLSSMVQSEGRYVARKPTEMAERHLPPESIPIRLLIEAFQTALDVKAELSIPDALIQPETYHVRDKMEDILFMLARAEGKLLFSETFRSGTRSELIVTFLALLELMKRRLVTVRQNRPFSEIFIVAREDGDDVEG